MAVRRLVITSLPKTVPPVHRRIGTPYPIRTFSVATPGGSSTVLGHRPAAPLVDLFKLLFEARFILPGTGGGQDGFLTSPWRRRPQPLLQRRLEEPPFRPEQPAG